MQELFTRDFYCQLKANDMDLNIALIKLEFLILDKTLDEATLGFSLEDLMNEQTSYSNGRNFLSDRCLLSPIQRSLTALFSGGTVSRECSRLG
jgi:hypothetical protein